MYGASRDHIETMRDFSRRREGFDWARTLLSRRAWLSRVPSKPLNTTGKDSWEDTEMRRNSLKLTALAAMALAGGAVGLNCSKGSNPNSGDVKLAVVLPSGATISTVTYSVKNSSSTTIAGPGTFTVTDPNATISLDIVVPVTPAGDAGDTVTLSATTSTGQSCTGTSAPFPVTAGTNTPVMMTLTCGSATASGPTGNIGITTTLVEGDHCPNILSAVIGPDQTSVGGTASVAATASDADLSETLSFVWAPSANVSGQVNTATSSSLTYHCTASGIQTLGLTVSDNHSPTPCTTTASLTINCVNVAVCGNNVVEPGETCDPPNGTTCSSTCQTIAGTGGTTGTGGVAGTTGAAGAPATGGSTGTGGIVATGGSTGTGGIVSTGGAGGMSMVVEDNAACVSCELTGTQAGTCAGTSPAGGGTSAANFGCDGLASATDKANCLALVGCLRTTACQNAIHTATADYGEAGTYPQPFDDPHPCLCGNTTLATCVSMTSGWTGVCAPQFVAAAAADGQTVSNAYTSPSSPVGLAVNLSICDIDNSCQSSCMI